ncbi:hypothetical protein MLD38_032851 [Melastoma candidum]|uniref:Uncharacterized protein n=1 Tax=Melastoma candidum TaxID=119954 RepID=A0ACB9M7D5_9MYRT|nr:hypothetical protein MLD38_032851 [Melastoma candidum]
MQFRPRFFHHRAVFPIARRAISRFAYLNLEFNGERPRDRPDIDVVPVTDEAYWTGRIRALCFRRRDVDGALQLVANLRVRGYTPNSVNIGNVVYVLCDSGRFAEAFDWFVLSVLSGVVPDEQTCNFVIARLLESGDPDRVLDVLRRLGGARPEYVCRLSNYNRLVHLLCKKRRFCKARDVLFEARSKGHVLDCVSWTTLITGYGEFGDAENAQKVFNEMCANGVMPNSLTYAALASGYLRKQDLETGREFISKTWDAMKREADVNVNSAAFACVVDSLCKGGFFNEVFRISMFMPQGSSVPEVYSYGQVIDSLCKFGKYSEALGIVRIMQKKGLLPSHVSYNSIVHGLATTGACTMAYQLFKEGVEFGYFPSEYIFKVLVEALCEASDIGNARSILDYMLTKDNLDRTRIYNIYLRALHNVKNPNELLNLLVTMLQNGCDPDVVSLNTVIHAFCKVSKIDEAIKILDDMENGQFCSPNAVTYTTVICGLLGTGRTSEALSLFNKAFAERSLRPHLVTYNAILQGLFKLTAVKEAEEIYNSMVSQGVVADCTTFCILISGLCDCGEIDKAKRLWDDVILPSNTHDDHVYSALLKGICKSGDFSGAQQLLFDMVTTGLSPNVFSYNVVLDKACQMGLKREAYKVFHEMKKNGVTPDAITWRILHKLHKKVGSRLPPKKSKRSTGESLEETGTTSLSSIFAAL